MGSVDLVLVFAKDVTLFINFLETLNRKKHFS